MDFQVPLNRLKFGQDDGAGINARVAGRLDGIEALAANLHAVGQIENLVVKPCGGDFYSVSNGNRRLAALRMIHGDDSDAPINCTLRDVDEAQAFEDSLITAVTAKQLHPVDQYEAFARLDERGKTHEEIAQQYGMTEKEVRQALALGRLSPKIRDAWRRGEIKAEVAQAFTLALDHKTQDKLYAKLDEQNDLDRHSIRAELGVKGNADLGALVKFVGLDAYRERGGHVTEDLFKEQHIVSDDVLLKAMVGERLTAECEKFVAGGWAWASVMTDLPASWRSWPVTRVDVDKLFTPEEAALFAQLKKELGAAEEDDDYDYEACEAINAKIIDLQDLVRPRGFTPKQMAKLGCAVGVDDDDGTLIITMGISRPAATSKTSAAAATPTAGEAPPVKAPTKTDDVDISQALMHRLSVQFTIAAQTALIQDRDLAISVLLAGLATSGYCEGVKASVSGLGRAKLDLLGGRDFAANLELAQALKPPDRIDMLVLAAGAALDFQAHSTSQEFLKGNAALLCDTIAADTMNAALRGAFEAKDYFDSVSKTPCLLAIKEALGADIARQQESKPKADIAAFALANVPATGWLPPQLRGKAYDGPPTKKAAVAAKPAAKTKPGKPAAAAPLKKAAAAKKVAKKTTAKPVAKKAAKKPAAKKRKA